MPECGFSRNGSKVLEMATDLCVVKPNAALSLSHTYEARDPAKLPSHSPSSLKPPHSERMNISLGQRAGTYG